MICRHIFASVVTISAAAKNWCLNELVDSVHSSRSVTFSMLTYCQGLIKDTKVATAWLSSDDVSEMMRVASNQRLPADLGSSSCVATQHAPHNSIFITGFSSLYILPDSTIVFLVSQQERAKQAVFVFPQAAVITT